MRRFHRRKKKVVRWFSSNEGYLVRGTAGFVISNTPGDIAQATLAVHARNASPTPDLLERDQRHTLEAVRGTIVVGAPPDLTDADCLLHLGLAVVDVTTTVGGDKHDPGDPADAPFGWMWLWHGLVPRMATPQNFWQPNIDVHVKTKRVMRDNEALVLFGTCDAQPGSADPAACFFAPYLRLLVSHGE